MVNPPPATPLVLTSLLGLNFREQVILLRHDPLKLSCLAVDYRVKINQRNHLLYINVNQNLFICKIGIGFLEDCDPQTSNKPLRNHQNSALEVM